MRHGHPRDIPDSLNRTLLLARRLRRQMTIPEIKLWNRLRRNQLGLKFRRQHPLGPYVADFFCAPASVVVELDGGCHRLTREHDEERDRWMRSRALLVLRYGVPSFERNPDAVVADIVRHCQSRMAAPAHAPIDAPPSDPRRASDHLPPSSTGGGRP